MKGLHNTKLDTSKYKNCSNYSLIFYLIFPRTTESFDSLKNKSLKVWIFFFPVENFVKIGTEIYIMGIIIIFLTFSPHFLWNQLKSVESVNSSQKHCVVREIIAKWFVFKTKLLYITATLNRLMVWNFIKK